MPSTGVACGREIEAGGGGPTLLPRVDCVLGRALQLLAARSPPDGQALGTAESAPGRHVPRQCLPRTGCLWPSL